ncbi:hypothetical protein [Bacillus mycoides]|uniref:hypothetical protein n=1 Tax=Bacillus mycoides TaxID=1405 RepID=UPI001C028563|nr:hypothetical protein [Bacillus mycoides]QWI47258.1 hypothetical protein EXW55_31040 [Bacillus mycoides]
MNSYNNNEYEIIDSHASPYPTNRNNDHSRYPYTNNPNHPMQNTNYKDVFNVKPANYYACELPSSMDWSKVITTSLNIIGTLLGGVEGATGASILTVNNILPFYWPSNNSTVWEDFIRQGNTALPTQDITEAVKSIVIGKINGLYASFRAYQTALEKWKYNKDEQNRDEVKFRFQYTVREISSALAGEISLTNICRVSF